MPPPTYRAYPCGGSRWLSALAPRPCCPHGWCLTPRIDRSPPFPAYPVMHWGLLLPMSAAVSSSNAPLRISGHLPSAMCQSERRGPALLYHRPGEEPTVRAGLLLLSLLKFGPEGTRLEGSATREVRNTLLEYEQCLSQSEWPSYPTSLVRAEVFLDGEQGE
jgi:hypothetical protein